MAIILNQIVAAVVWLISLVVIADVVVSYFLSPYNEVRSFLDRLVNPLLTPIRKVVPPVGGIDFSPIVLLLLVQVVGNLLVSTFR